MPAPSSSSMTSGIADEITAADEIKVFHDEGEQGEETVCDRTSSHVDLHDIKQGLVEPDRELSRISRDNHERNRLHAEKAARSAADSYKHHAYMLAAAQAAQANAMFAGGSSHFGYPHMNPMMPPYGGFPTVGSPSGMQIPKPIALHSPPLAYPTAAYSQLLHHRSPYQLHDPHYCTHGSTKMMTGSPIPVPTSPFLGPGGTPPPAHMGMSRGCSPFMSVNMMSPHAFSGDLAGWPSMWSQSGFRHSNSPFAPPTMAGSPFPTLFRHSMTSPLTPYGHHYPHHFGVPQSPDLMHGRFSGHGHHNGHGEVSSSRVSHSSASSTSSNRDPSENRFGRTSKKDKNHVKKPLNAFMLYMKEMRAEVQKECTLKESAAINQILGKKWHALDREAQHKYYEMAKQERENHAKEYPGWTAKDNYALCGKKKRRKKEKSDEPKKCRAIFGIDRQPEWCKPCKRKKKCIRYTQNGILIQPNGAEYPNHHEPKSSSESISCVSSSMQALSPSGESVASSSMSPASATASTG